MKLRYWSPLLLAALLLAGCPGPQSADLPILPDRPDPAPDDPLIARLNEVYPEGYRLVEQSYGTRTTLELTGEGTPGEVAVFLSEEQGHIGVIVEQSPGKYELIGFATRGEDTGLTLEITDWDLDGTEEFLISLDFPGEGEDRVAVYDYRSGRIRRILSESSTGYRILRPKENRAVLVLPGPDASLRLFGYVPEGEMELQQEIPLSSGLSQPLLDILVNPDGSETLLVRGEIPAGAVTDLIGLRGEKFHNLFYEEGPGYSPRTLISWPVEPADLDGDGSPEIPGPADPVRTAGVSGVQWIQWLRFAPPESLLPVTQTLEIQGPAPVRFRIPERWNGRIRLYPADPSYPGSLSSAEVRLVREDGTEASLFSFALFSAGLPIPEELTPVAENQGLVVAVDIREAREDSVLEGFEFP